MNWATAKEQLIHNQEAIQFDGLDAGFQLGGEHEHAAHRRVHARAARRVLGAAVVVRDRRHEHAAVVRVAAGDVDGGGRGESIERAAWRGSTGRWAMNVSGRSKT